MKRHLAFGLIVLMLASLACQVSLTPTLPPPVPSETPIATLTPIPTITETPTTTPTPPLSTSQGPALLELRMFSTSRGWGRTENQILITNNGGLTWAQVPLPGVAVDSSVSTYFISPDIAYFFAPIPGAKIGQLFATRDGGATWQITVTPFTNAKLYFTNDNIGFAFQTLSVVNNLMTVAIYQSLDRGANWTQTFIHAENQGDTNLPVSGIKTGMSFIDPSRGFIGLLSQQNSIGFYRTGDSGRAWVKQELPLPDGIENDYESTVWAPFFLPANSNDGFLAIDFVDSASGASNRIFYLTHDGGQTWEKNTQFPEGAAYFFLDPQTGWAWSENTLYTTTDGAQTWNLLPAAFGPSERASIINFPDTLNGWLVTVDARNILRMYRTTDGGGTWTAIIP